LLEEDQGEDAFVLSCLRWLTFSLGKLDEDKSAQHIDELNEQRW